MFDGYDGKPSTKDTTHVRRTKGKKSISMHFTGKMKLNMKKNVFLTNLENKQLFLEMLVIKMNEAKLNAIQSSGDSDVLIVQTAVSSAATKPTVIIGEDIDLLILFLHHARNDGQSIFFTSEQKLRSKGNTKLWDLKYVKSKLGNKMCEAILLIHALRGCDTTSRLYSIDKGVTIQRFKREECFRRLTKIFNNPTSSREDVISAGERLLLIVYGAKGDTTTLDKLHLIKFCEKPASSIKVVSPDSLPPTSAAASFHSLRVYHQVQVWRRQDDLDPELWGWAVKSETLVPVFTSKALAPASLLKLFRCNCIKECRSARCACFKNGLKCSAMCGEYRGVSCLNFQDPCEIENGEIIDEI